MEGIVQPAEGEWRDFLRKVTDEARVEVVPTNTAGSKAAILNYRVMETLTGGMLIELRPMTGRTHQLRVQTASRGYPIRGDELYGSVTLFGPPAQLPRDRTIALHAHQLTFLHPIRYEPVIVTRRASLLGRILAAGRRAC